MTRRFTPGPDQSRALRDALGSFATGVTVITTQGDQGPIGMTANSFASVSLDPALVLWSIAKTSDRFAAFRNAERYAIHVLAADQASVSTAFARAADAFDTVAWSQGAQNIPDIHGCLARFDCRLVTTHDAGDHVILVGNILDVIHRDGAPLVFAGGHYADLTAR